MRQTRLALPILMALAILPAAANEHGQPHWSYSGAEGPSHWGGTCETGKSQSPIDIKQMTDEKLAPLYFEYSPGGYRVVNNGHAVQVDFNAGSRMTIQGHAYDLKQVHFHTPSENHVAGKAYPMEAHFVHADAKGNLAVVAVMFENGAANAWLDSIAKSIPAKADSEHALPKPVAATNLLPSNREYYSFDGSLTTPPCSEGVRWLVMKNPVTATPREIALIHAAIGHDNARPVQPLNTRVVVQ